ncbi:hypothetical protein POM88_050046 [Heracleum sosnowskyi]|uniref:Uncharacterized protein n=1 Tax=Heracleum sosnowskyi TaxID=360622 RepID=A0AAD8M010_9APIA|nr:hypothetical protein POM88_050046 [Heracleum sosnowskyi]
MYWVSKNNHVGHNDGDTSVNMMWWDSYPYSSHSFVSRRDWRLFLIILLCQLFMQQTEHKILKLYGVTMSFLHFTGVLLLNSVLTVRQHQANSHAKKGWEQYTDAVIETISKKKRGVVFLLWGNYAQVKSSCIIALAKRKGKKGHTVWFMKSDAPLVPNSAEKSLKEVMEEIMGDHEMMDFAFVDDDVDGGWMISQ